MKDYTKNKKPEELEPFFPNEIFRHIIAACFLAVIELIAVIAFPLPWKFSNKPDHIPWFFLPIYRLQKLVQSDILFITLLAFSALIFISLPFLADMRKCSVPPFGNRHDMRMKKINNLWQRPILLSAVIVVIIFVITLCFINP